MTTTMEHATVTAPDISCAHCVMTIEKAVGALPGVASVQADAATRQVEIAFNPVQVSLAQIQETLDEVGYPVVTSST